MPRRQERPPVYEPIVPPSNEGFVWRTDDYPLSWSVWNAHPECEIHLIRNAVGTCHVGDHIGGFSAGDLFIVGRGLPHNWVTPLAPGEKVQGRDVILQFDEDRIMEAAGPFPELVDLKSFLLLARRGLAFTGETRRRGADIVETIGKKRSLERLSLFFGLLHLLSTSTERELLSSENFAPQIDVSTNHALRNILTWMSVNYRKDIRLQEPAEMAGMTETSFSRFFKKNTGNTFSRYLSELRMAKACELLDRSELAVTEIAAEVGYENLSNFNRTFRELRGMAPRRYRQFRRSRELT